MNSFRKSQKSRVSQKTVDDLNFVISPNHRNLRSIETKKRSIVEKNALIILIYSQYDFKFCCDFSQQRRLKLLSFAKPLIQYFIDKLINELVTINRGVLIKAYRIDSLVNAFIPMYMNQMTRVTSEILEREFSVYSGYREGSHSEQQRRAFIFIMQDKLFIQQLNKKYPELFNDMLEVSDNWLEFMMKFAGKLQVNYNYKNDFELGLLCG